MRKMTHLFLVSLLILSGNIASACGHKARRTRRSCPPPPYRQPAQVRQTGYAVPPAYVPQASLAPPPVAYQPAPARQPAASPVAPTYDYAADGAGRSAYYYTYDSSGKLIIQQWMDFVFRGGKEAGMPRPPLPVIGWFQGS